MAAKQGYGESTVTETVAPVVEENAQLEAEKARLGLEVSTLKEELFEIKGSCEEAAKSASAIGSEEQEQNTAQVEKLSTDLARSKQLVAVAQEG